MYMYIHTDTHFFSSNHRKNTQIVKNQIILKNTYGWSIYAEFSGQHKESFSQHIDIHLLKDKKSIM